MSYDPADYSPDTIWAQRQAETSLLDFTRQGWREIEPSDFEENWHIDCLCDHFEAVANGELKRVIFNMPPRHMKSRLLNVFFPAWIWAQPTGLDENGIPFAIVPGTWRGAGVKFMNLTYRVELATRDSVACRRLIQSKWYQKNWGSRVHLRDDQNEKKRYDTVEGGQRISTSPSGVMGEGGDIISYDDPHDYGKIDSPAELTKLLTFFDEGLSTRFNDRARGALIICMQRLDDRDLTGHVLAKELNAIAVHGPSERKWVHVCLPARFETDHPFPTRTNVANKATGEIWKDPRVEGELLWPARMNEQALHDLIIELGSPYAEAGQLQQRPMPRSGGLFKRAWFGDDKFLPAAPPGTKWLVRHWDLAATAKATAAYTCGLLLGKTPDGNWLVGNVIREQLEGHDVRTIIKGTAEMDGFVVEISLPQDPGQAGKVQAADMTRMLSGFRVHAEPESGDKVVRAEPVAAQAARGNLYLIKAPWNQAFVDELCSFPNGKFKDQVDSLSGAFGRANARKGESAVGYAGGSLY